MPAGCIPHSVVVLDVMGVSQALVTELLATRDHRALQTLKITQISDSSIASLIGALVSTDRKKKWRLKAWFSDDAGRAFCTTVMNSYSKSGFLSLRNVTVHAGSRSCAAFAALLTLPSLFSFVMEPRVGEIMSSEFESHLRTWCHLPAVALTKSQNLHTLVVRLPKEHLEASVQTNHSIIRSHASDWADFANPLLHNRVMTSLNPL